MLQYLLNVTAIWLLSLVLFDVFLKKENYHWYNRFYLLFTFLLGAFLPLMHWQKESEAIITQAVLQRPVQQLITTKETIVSTTMPATNFNWAQIFTAIYLIGVIIALSLLLIDIIKLSRFYNGTKRSKEGNWLVIETGKDHAPFSFLKTLFINNKMQYSSDEWNMVLLHEKRHYTLLHFADLTLMQLAGIVLWFHPLVHLYNKRLLLVHEYQADKTFTQPQAYGKFLIEQALLSSAPTLAHSFNRSPIKKRIAMLTHRSSGIAKSKFLLLIPLLFVCVLCFSQSNSSKDPQKVGNKCVYKGNTIEFLAPKKPDSYLYTDEKTGEQTRKPITWPMPPIKLNGQKIYDHYKDKDIQSTAMLFEYTSLEDCVMKNVKAELEKLDDGEYFITIGDIVVDANGTIAYFDNQGVFRTGGGMDEHNLQKKNIDSKITDLMYSSPAYIPARVNGKRVPYLVNDGNGWTFTVKDHSLQWDDRPKKKTNE